MSTYGLGTHLIDWVVLLLICLVTTAVALDPVVARWRARRVEVKRAASLLAAIRSGKISIE